MLTIQGTDWVRAQAGTEVRLTTILRGEDGMPVRNELVTFELERQGCGRFRSSHPKAQADEGTASALRSNETGRVTMKFGIDPTAAGSTFHITGTTVDGRQSVTWTIEVT